MIAQIFEPFSGGHHTKYVAFILPALIRLRDAGHLERIVLTTTSRHRESSYFADSLERYCGQIVLDVVPAGDIYGSGHIVTGMLLDAVKRHRPDYIVSTSADNGSLSLALRCLLRSEFRRRNVTSVGIMHYGSYERISGYRARVRESVHRFSRFFSPWTEIHVPNPLLYDYWQSFKSATSKRVKLLPDPVEIRAPVAKADARSQLGLPARGIYVGQIGQSNATKAIPELLAAFRSADLPRDRRLLMAGRVHAPFRELIDRSYGDLVQQERLVLMDRYLQPEELHLAACAVDLIAVADNTGKLSSTLLAAIAAERPVLADRGGYTGRILSSTGAGFAADLRDHASFTAALRTAVTGSCDFRLSAEAKRLLHDHDPQNFADALLRPLYARLEHSVAR